jgi:hypothetical protein
MDSILQVRYNFYDSAKEINLLNYGIWKEL